MVAMPEHALDIFETNPVHAREISTVCMIYFYFAYLMPHALHRHIDY